VEKAVVGLNLCPFANAVLKKERLHIQVSEATEPLALLEDLRTELKRLLDAPETEIETSLLVCPRMLSDFLEFNDFLDMAEALLTELDLNGTVQIASFHPHYQFAGTAVDDIENATNQSPWPTLHLLRRLSCAGSLRAGRSGTLSQVRRGYPIRDRGGNVSIKGATPFEGGCPGRVLLRHPASFSSSLRSGRGGRWLSWNRRSRLRRLSRIA